MARILLATCLAMVAGAQGEDTFYQGYAPDHVSLSRELDNSTVPAVALDRQQNSHVAWKVGRDIYYAKSDPGGNWLLKEGDEFIPHVKLASLSTAVSTPAIAVDYDGAAHIVASTPASILYLKIGPDGNEQFRRGLHFGLFTQNQIDFMSADIAINPKTNLPVVATKVEQSHVKIIYGYSFRNYIEKIYVLRLDGDGVIEARNLFAASEWSLGAPAGRLGPPSVAVDPSGMIHAVWKAVEANDNSPADAGGDANAALADRFAADTIHGVGWSKGDRMVQYSNWLKASTPINILTIWFPSTITRYIPVRIGTPNDIDAGNLYPRPRIAADASGKVHVGWTGRVGDRRAVLYSRVDPAGESQEHKHFGTVEQRSVEISGSNAQVEPVNCDLAVGDSAVHFVWADARSGNGRQIYHGAVTLESGALRTASEYRICEARGNLPNNPRIAFRPRKEFLKWEGYEGDTTNPPFNNFDANEPRTVVNLYDKDIEVRATFKPWPSGQPCPADPVIQLPGQGTGHTFEEIPIAADDGRGTYTVVWQEDFVVANEIALHRPKYRAGVFGLWPRFSQPNRLWQRSDAANALGEGNRQTGFWTDEPISLRNEYRELIRDSNYHAAQGVIADGVTPLIIRTELPVGDYYLQLRGEDAAGTNLAEWIESARLFIFNHNLDEFVQYTIGGIAFSVRSEHAGLPPRETIFLIKGFDHSHPDVRWPYENPPDVPVQLRLWQRPVNELLDMTEQPPFAIVPFAVGKPPVIMVHGFNNMAEGWSKEFKAPIEAAVGGERLMSIEYGQNMVGVGPLAELSEYLRQLVGENLADEISAVIDEYDTRKGQFDDITEVLKDLGVLPEDDDDDDGFDPMGTILDLAKKALYWEKAANAHAPLATLEKEIALNLYAAEELIRHKHQWAFTRYDVVGHCQGGVLLRMLCNNNHQKAAPSSRFLHERNFGRGRFRRVVAIGSPFRGSRLTQYFRHYKAHLIEQVLESLDLPPVETVGIGLALMYYADRNGYLEPKFDAFEGEIKLLRTSHPVHPSARFHYVSTVIDHDAYLPNILFSGAGLIKDAPPSFGLFQHVFQPYDPAPSRFTDGLIGWRSHLAGIDYTDPANAGYFSHLDEFATEAGKQFAAHIPPIPLTAIVGEPPGPPGWKDIYDIFKEAKSGEWHKLLARMATGLVQKYADSSKASFSLFGTSNTQTNMKEIGGRIAEILARPVDEHFRDYVEYNPVLPQGEGNPEGWPHLGTQDDEMGNRVRTKIRYLFAARDAELFRWLGSREPLPPGQYRYKLMPPDDLPLVGQPMWSAHVMNALICNAQGITLEVDPIDSTIVTLTIDPNVYGFVILQVSYWTTDDVLVQVQPLIVAEMNMGEMTGIHFAQFVPVLRKGEKVFLTLNAEQTDGYYGPLFADPDVPQSWTSSAPEIVAVEPGGMVIAGAKAGRATVTATYGNFTATASIRVVGDYPTVVLTEPQAAAEWVGGDDLPLAAHAEDEDGTIESVVFFANGQAVGQSADTANPHTFLWTNLRPGIYTVYAVAVDDDDQVAVSESRTIEVANRPPTIDAWPAPVAELWYAGDVYCAVEASDPDDDPIIVQFEYSLDSTDGTDGRWAQCYYPLSQPPFDFAWTSRPVDGVDDQVWLRVWAVDTSGARSETLTRRIKIDNSTPGMVFNPHPGETGVPLGTHPTVTFDNPVTKPDGSPLTNADLPAFFGFARQGTPLPFSATINAEKTVVTLVPDEPMWGVTPHTVSLLADLKDAVSGDLHRRTDATFVTTYGAAAALQFRTAPIGGEAGAGFDRPVKVHVVDNRGNTVRDSVVVVTLALAGGGDLAGGLTANAVAGIASFADLSMTAAGTFRLLASADGLAGAESGDVVVRPSALARLEVVPGAATVVAGVRLSATVAAFDRFDNPKTDYRGTPNFVSSDSRASLPPPYTFYESDRGVHTYRNTLIMRTRGAQTVRVWDGKTNSPPAVIEVANAPPLPPVPTQPADGGFAGLAPTLTIGPFVDVDDAIHAGSRFQVATDAEFAEIIWDSGELPASLSVALPDQVLAEFTNYHWRARVKDSSGDPASEWSPWSTMASFTTAYRLPFVDPFANNRGWQGLAPGKWMIGPALAGGGEYGHPGPGEDASGSPGNGILGFNIGGDYLPDADAYVTSPPIDCSTAGIVELAFQRWLGVEGAPWGRASILVSADGRQWHQVWANPDTDVADSQWHPLTFDITPWAAGQPTVFVRFRMGPMNAAYPFCGWHVDDLELRAGEDKLARILLEIPETDIKVGDYFFLNVYVQEDHPEANGIMGAAVDVDFPEVFVTYRGPTNVLNTVPNPPWNLFRRGNRLADIIRELGGLTGQTGHGDGVPTLLASIRFSAERAGLARFEVAPAAGFGLATPVGQIGPWRVQPAILELPIAPASLAPLVLLRLDGPAKPVALGNSFEVKVYVKEMSAQASGVLGGPFDLYFDPARVSAPNFSAITAIQPPYTDIQALDPNQQLVSGTLLENRIDELGGATLQTGHGNGVDKLYAVLVFQADAVGQAVFKAEPGSAGFALTTPVGQVDISRIDYGAPCVVDIRPNVHLTVANGVYASGNGNYVEGEMVAVAANPPATGMAFSHWEGDVAHLANPQAASTTLTMPATDIAITAAYVPVDYLLTVNLGSGSTATAHYQDVIPIQANPPAIGKLFDRWDGNVAHLDDPFAESATVTMPAAHVTLTAVYRNILYTLAVENGSGSTSTAIYQQPIAIAANPAPMGYAFSHWTGDVEFLANAYAASTTVTMPADPVAVAAAYVAIDYALTVNHGSGSTATANYQDVIPIAADPPAIGQAFAGWIGDVEFLADAKALETEVVMPARQVAVTATYEPIPYTLLVVNGSGSGSGTYNYGDVVDIAAAPPAAGQPAFAAWVGHTDQLADPNAANTTVTMPAAHVAVVAVYGAIGGGSVDIPLVKGWNCIAVPFAVLSPVDRPEYAHLISGKLWDWDGQFFLAAPAAGGGRQANGLLEPLRGYWLYSPNGGTLTLHSP